MDRLHEQIKRCITEDRVVFSIHADNQLAFRRVPRWQAVAGLHDGTPLESHPKARPNPRILVRQLLPDGSACVAVWSHVRSIDSAKLVPLIFEDDRE